MTGQSDYHKDQAGQKAELTKAIQEGLAKEALEIYGSHPPLDASKKQIRLLSVYDNVDPSSLLTGELHVANLDADYTALSYVWGDWHNRRPIRINGVDTTITASLEIVLNRLRTEKKVTSIWIDAICINQTDSTEKSHQVQMMGDIFLHANLQTFLWLGEAENHSDEAMKLLSIVDKPYFDDYDPEIPSLALEGLGHLLKRDWWKRMWVIQEMMLSPNPIVKCGAEEVNFERFVVFRNLYWDAENADRERFRPLRSLWRECPFTYMFEYHRRRWLGGHLGLWLMDVALFQSLHLRDKVYGLLGLISEETRNQITVEYDPATKSDRTVLLEATRLCFVEGGLLHLHQGQVEKDTSLGLPSWCPDWNSKALFQSFIGFGFSPYPVKSFFRPPTEKWLFGRDREEKPEFVFSQDKEILFLHGFVVDTVDFVDGVGTEETPAVPVYTGDDPEVSALRRAERLDGTKKACLRWMEHVRNSKSKAYATSNGGYEEAFSRSVAANRTFDREELGDNVKSVFDTWVDREKTSDGDSNLKPESAKRVQDYSNSVVSRCAKRTFITTTTGYFGLAPQKTNIGDLVCIVYSGAAAYIFRQPEPDVADTPGSFVGEAYVHGIMQGEYLDTAKGEDFTAFWLK
jgi:hypothetical protein